MQLGMIGLGRMGANMTTRLLLDHHDLVVFDFNPAAVEHSASEGAIEMAIPREALRLRRGTALSVGVALVGTELPLDGSTFDAAAMFTPGE